MKLLVDIGNSRVKWTTMDNSGLNESQSFDRNKSGIKASLNKVWKTLSEIESVYVANVAGEKIAAQLTEWTEKQWNLTPKFIQAEKKHFGVTNAYDEPAKLGIDRWLSLISARQHARLAQCIIDCGTAITVDIVTKAGQHQGGMIIPGISIMKSSLVNNTDALTTDTDDQEFKTLATNTYSAIQTGTLYAVTATIERIISDLKESFNNRIRFIITGGDAQALLPLLSDDVHYYPDIVLKGLAFYARQDKAKPAEKNKSKAQKSQISSDVDGQEKTETAADVTDKTAPNTVETSTENDNPSPETITEEKKKPARKPGKTRATKPKSPAKTKKQASDPSLPEEAI